MPASLLRYRRKYGRTRTHRQFRICALLLCGAALAQAAAAPGPAQQQAPLAARVELVNVDATVTDARGNFIRDLKRDNFRILDDGVEQPITHFASIEAPAVVLVLVETGPAVYLIHRQHLEAAYALLDGLAPDDRVAVASYDQSARLLAGFTPDKAVLAAAMSGLRYNLGAGELRLYDSVAAALDWLAPIPGKKAVVLLSTGLDTSGTNTWDTLAERLSSSEAALYPIALGGELRGYVPRSNHGGQERDASPGPAELSFAQADRVLQQMAELTGGRAWFPRAAQQFPGIYREIAATLRHRYSLAFTPPARNARFHRIEVQLLDDRGQFVASSNPASEAASDRLPPTPRQQNRHAHSTPTRRAPPAPRFRLSARYGYTAPAP